MPGPLHVFNLEKAYPRSYPKCSRLYSKNNENTITMNEAALAAIPNFFCDKFAAKRASLSRLQIGDSSIPNLYKLIERNPSKHRTDLLQIGFMSVVQKDKVNLDQQVCKACL